MLHLTPENDVDAEDDDLPWYVLVAMVVIFVLLDRRVMVLLAGVAVVAGMLLLAGCTPSLIRVEAPRFSPAAAAAVDSRQSGTAGKADVTSKGRLEAAPAPAVPSISDAQLQAWLDGFLHQR